MSCNINKMKAISLLSYIWLSIAVFIQPAYTEESCLMLKNTPAVICETKDSVPDNYHICNNEDIDVVAPFSLFDNVFNETIKTIYTDLTTEANHQIIISKSNKTLEATCLLNGALLESSTEYEVSPCITCFCYKGTLKCDDKCITKDIERENTDKITVFEGKTIHEKEHYLACPDTTCRITGCKKCTLVNGKEKCLQCAEPYYLFNKNQYTCYSSVEVYNDCNGFVKYNPEERTASCADCINGEIEEIYDDFEPIKLHDMYEEYLYGSCNCDTGVEGYFCDEQIRDEIKNQECFNGEVINNKCYCNHGYYGANCSNKIKCVYGTINHNTCACYLGYSGIDCSIPYFDKERRDSLILSEEHKIDNKCLQGWYGEECKKYICKNGKYDFRLDLCLCEEGFFGKYCDKSCDGECNYNGNKCNLQDKCLCLEGFYGEKCQYKIIESDSILNYHNVTFSFNSTILREDNPCYENNCYQYRIYFNETGDIEITSPTYFTINNTRKSAEGLYYNNSLNKVVLNVEKDTSYYFFNEIPKYIEERNNIFIDFGDDDMIDTNDDMEKESYTEAEKTHLSTAKTTEYYLIVGVVTIGLIIVGIIVGVNLRNRNKPVLPTVKSINTYHRSSIYQNKQHNLEKTLTFSRNPMFKM